MDRRRRSTHTHTHFTGLVLPRRLGRLQLQEGSLKAQEEVRFGSLGANSMLELETADVRAAKLAARHATFEKNLLALDKD